MQNFRQEISDYARRRESVDQQRTDLTAGIKAEFDREIPALIARFPPGYGIPEGYRIHLPDDSHDQAVITLPHPTLGGVRAPGGIQTSLAERLREFDMERLGPELERIQEEIGILVTLEHHE